MRTHDLRHLGSLLALLVTLLGASGCPGGGGPADAGLAADGGGLASDGGASLADASRPSQCQREAALLDQAGDCARDDQCPCGAYCKLGLCAHDCLADSECGGGWCDSSGRCRAAADLGAVAPLAVPAIGDLELSTDGLVLYDRTAQSGFRLRAARAALGPVRIAADEGLRVDCQGAPARECLLDVGTGQEIQVIVRPAASGPLPEGLGLNVYSRTSMRRVAVSGVAAVPTAPPQPGVYVGTLSAQSARAAPVGAQPLVAEPVSADLMHLELPIEVRVHPDGTLTFVDALGVLGKPAAGQPFTWTFRLDEYGRFTAVSDAVDLSRHALAGRAGSTADTSAADVGASASGTALASGTSLRGTLDVAVDGLGLVWAPPILVDERPVISWRFAAERTGDLPAGEAAPALGGGVAPAFGASVDRYGHRLPFEEAVATAVGTAGLGWAASAKPETVAQHYLCYDHPSLLASVPMDPAAAGLTASGDLRCHDSASPWRSAFPLFTNSERGGSALNSKLMMRACEKDLQLALGALPAPVPGGAAGLDVLSGCGPVQPCDPARLPDCVDAPLVLRALGLSLDQVQRSGMPDLYAWPAPDADGEAALRLAHRVAQQWAQTLTFVAREARQGSNVLLGGTPQDLAGALDLSVAGWDVLLHPRVAGRLFHLPPALLRQPDYRGDPSLASAMSEDQTAAVGLPVALAEALRAQLQAAQQLVNRARFTGARMPPAQVGAMLRHVALIYPLAELLHARAATGAAVPWEPQWQTARQGLLTALRDLFGEVRALSMGANPLGVDDDDLPLYRDNTSPADPGQRFSAVSGYLIDGWAQGAVADATAAKAAAKAAWAALAERALQAEVDSAERAARLAELKRSYGEKVLTLCGNPQDLAASEVLGSWSGLSAKNCFLDKQNPACSYDEKELIGKLTLDDVSYQMCFATLLQLELGKRAALDDASVQEMVDDLADEVRGAFDTGSADFWGRLDPGVVQVGWDVLSQLNIGVPPPGMTAAVTSTPWATVESAGDAEAIAEAASQCKARFPNAVSVSARVQTLESSPLDRPECYQGSLGELALTVRAASKDVDVAKNELQDFTDAYRKAMEKCTLADDALQKVSGVQEKLGAIENRLGVYTNTMNQFIDGVTEVGDLGMGIASFAAGGDVGTLTSSVSGAFSFLGDWTKSGLDNLLGLSTVQQAHAEFMQAYQDKITLASCFKDAEMHLVGAQTQAQRIQRSQLDLSRAIVQMRNSQAELARLITEGRRRVAAEQSRQRASLFLDTWEDITISGQQDYQDAIAKYARSLRLAQRTVYLAVRAVEYEWQKSHSARALVLAATEPAQLEAILADLKQEIGTNTINGQRAENMYVVVSLKQHLMQLADRSAYPAGQKTPTDTERLRAVLTSPRYAHHKADGAYAGQLVPFSVMPLASLKLGTPGSVPLLTGSDCAERVWAVNAVVQGKDVLDGQASLTRIELWHRDTFFSQWCLPPTAGADPMQSASVRPSRNLFKDPVWGAASDTTGSAVRDASGFAKSRLQAYLNIERGELEKESYTQGSSEELATRGLYGEYALFFPAEQLAVGGAQGLHLERIDDVLLRYDYVSVAKSW